MKTKAKIILKSLLDLPANTLALGAAVPSHALNLTRRVLTPPARANAPLNTTNSWANGGLNE